MTSNNIIWSEGYGNVRRIDANIVELARKADQLDDQLACALFEFDSEKALRNDALNNVSLI